MSYIDKAFVSLGLHTPLRRTAAGVSLAVLALQVARPGFAFNDDGYAKEFALLSTKPDSTYFPWYGVALVIGISAGVFI